MWGLSTKRDHVPRKHAQPGGGYGATRSAAARQDRPLQLHRWVLSPRLPSLRDPRERFSPSLRNRRRSTSPRSTATHPRPARYGPKSVDSLLLRLARSGSGAPIRIAGGESPPRPKGTRRGGSDWLRRVQDCPAALGVHRDSRYLPSRRPPTVTFSLPVVLCPSRDCSQRRARGVYSSVSVYGCRCKRSCLRGVAEWRA